MASSEEKPALQPPLRQRAESGTEPFHRGGASLGLTLQDFWRWVGSDLLGNTMRGRVAEFIVGSAIGAVRGIRNEWDPFDLTSSEHVTVEVKSAAYVQAWAQAKPSRPVFTIAPTRGWSPETNVLERDAKRHAKVYVFALLAHEDRDTIDAMDVSQWRFYVLPTAILNQKVPDQKTISLQGLRRLKPVECGFDGLAVAVREADRTNG